LLATNSDFIIKLFATYNSTQYLYFLLEAALGGELYATYNRKGFHGSATHAKFYSAGVVFAFEHLHERRILYRDLKPENILISEKGETKLTDMGLAKFVIGKTFTTCGTPDYFSPELIASTGHTHAVDWWTLGILIFELMSGNPPFEAPSPMQIYGKVMKGIGKVKFPSKCQGAVGDLIRDLLKKDPAERLPMKAGGTKLLRQHPWYADFDWDRCFSLRMDPPYKPVVKSKTDIANFKARKEDMPRQIPYKDDGTGWDKDFESA
jgi:cGMP-dependent protein kinase